MDYEAHKRKTLAHCLKLAEGDPTYALWHAREWEARMPWLLTNLEAKVRQHIARSLALAQEADSGPGESGRV